MSQSRKAFWYSGFAALALATLNAQADESTPGAAAKKATGTSAAEHLMLEEIVITAKKREEKLQDVPLAVTALTSQRLEELGADKFEDYYRMVPGLAVIDRGPGYKKYILRGVNSENSGGLYTIVSQYVDEFPMEASGQQPDIRLYDVDRVEVLRGPQGTLYGAGAMGGTIKTILKHANSHEFQAIVEGTVSHTSGQNFLGNLVLNAPLIADKLAVRAVFYWEDIDGFIDNIALNHKDINTIRMTGGRLNTLWTPTQDLDLSLTYFYQREKGGALNEDSAGIPALPPVFPAGLPVPGRYQIIKSIDEAQFDENTIVNGTLNYRTSFATVTETSTYYRRHRIENQDITELVGYGGRLVYDSNPDTWAHELRVASAGSGLLQWIGGGYYRSDKSDYDASFQDAFFPGGKLAFRRGARNYARERAAFGELTVNLPQNVTATAGARWADYGTEAQGKRLLPTPRPPNVQTSSKDHATVSKYNLSWHVLPNEMLYLQAAQGFRPGGTNSIAFTFPNMGIPISYTSDTLWNYEFGSKGTFLDGRLVVDTALFHIDWSGIQVTKYTGPFQFVGNASQAQINGFEFETTAQVTANFSTTLSGAVLNPRLTQNQPGSCSVQRRATGDPSCQSSIAGYPGLSGDRLPNVPKISASWLGNYEFPLGTSRGFATGTVSYVGNSFASFRPDDPTNGEMHAYTLLNLRTGFRRSGFTVTAFVDNVANKRAELFINRFSGFERISVIRPRTVGMTIRKEF